MPPSYEDLYGGPPPTRPPTPAKGPTAAVAPAPVNRVTTGLTPGHWLKRFVADHLPGLTNLTDVKVWLYLYTRADADCTVTLSHAAIAKHFGITRRTSIRSMKRLRTRGLVKVKRQGGFPNRVTTYRVVGGKPTRQTRPVSPTTASDT